MTKNEELLNNTIRTCNTGTISITAKVTKRCNIRPACEYCYDFEAQSDNKEFDMSTQTLDNLIKKSVGSGDFNRVIFVWHGGEPLVVGKKFYQKALEFQDKYNSGKVIIENRLQTNAVAMDRAWINFLKTHNFKMESSFDAFDNDKSRGKSQQVLRNLLLAKDMDYAPGNVMFIVTKRNVNRLKEAYDYFNKRELNFTPSPIISLGQACQYKELSITPEEYGHSVVDLMDYILKQPKPKIKVRFIDAVLRSVLGFEQNLCSHGFCAYQFIASESSGEIYPCAKVDQPEWSFGNINELDKLSDIFSTEKYRKYGTAATNRLTDCLTENSGKPCEVFQHCKGGCASNSLAAGGYSKRDFYCTAYRIVFNHALNVRAELLKQLNNGG